MIVTILEFFDRDINKMINEIKLFRNEDNLWKVQGDIKNPAGNLALHIIGGNNHHIGAILGKTGYERNREIEFSTKDVPKAELISGLEKLKLTITKTFTRLTNEDLEKIHPAFFDSEGTTTGYVLTQLLLHLNYHLGQVNYLRRVLEPGNPE